MFGDSRKVEERGIFMWRLLFLVVCGMALFYVYRVYLYPRTERWTSWYRDPLKQRKGLKRYRYELLVEFSDGRQAQYYFCQLSKIQHQ